MKESAAGNVELDRILLSEHDTSPPITLSEAALDALDELNADTAGTRIEVEHRRDDTVRLKSSQYVGSVSLPDGPDIHIQPKAAGTNFLGLLRWAHGIAPMLHDERTRASSGRTFVETLGLLYAAELDLLLTRGPHREYQWTEATETRLRGRLDLQRQLQEQGSTATEFEVVYDELTTDTIANRGIQQAVARLARLVEEDRLAARLHQQVRHLSQWVGTTPVHPAELARVETTRLNAHYETILRLAEDILRHRYLDDFSSTGQSSFGLLVNMNRLFEAAVERTARAVVAELPGWTVQTQTRIPPIATGGTPSINMYPDFMLEYEGAPRLIGDAKWKTGTITQSDIYQMSAYMLALDVPGLLIYPEQTEPGVSVKTSYLIDERLDLLVHELPTASETIDSTYPGQLQHGLVTALSTVLDEDEWRSTSGPRPVADDQ